MSNVKFKQLVFSSISTPTLHSINYTKRSLPWQNYAENTESIINN